MADEQTEVVEGTENPAPEETTETVEEPVEGEQPAEGEPAPAEGEEAEPVEGEEPAEGEEAAEGEEVEEPAHKPNVVFKAGVYNKETKQLEQKEFTIDPKFAAIMTDPESEKLVRELHEKAFGLDSVKERFVEAKQFAGQVVKENTDIKGSINYVKGIYNSAVKTGNWLKLDDFFHNLDIPVDHILKYALAKVELNEMDPAQRQAVESRLESDRRAEKLTQERDSMTSEMATLAQANKQTQVEFVLTKPEVVALAAEFDRRLNKEGAFKEAVFKEGQMAWSVDNVDLPAAEAVERVIKNYGLTGVKAPAGTTPAAPTPGKTGAKTTTIVKRNASTIPNIGGRSTSPLPSKPKSMEEVLKYRKETHGF